MISPLKKTVCFFIIITLYLILLSSHALAAQANLQQVQTDTNLRAVYLIHDPAAEQIELHVTILAGEVDREGTEGLSHYLEHIVFWHADRENGEEMHGRNGNAWVNGLVTDYYNIADVAELDNMFHFAGKVLTEPRDNPDFMDEEKHVVVREYDLRMSENPERRALLAIRKLIYGDNPVGRSVIGTPGDILSLSLDDALKFHQTYYNASNTVLVVTGNIGTGEIKDLVNKTFSKFPAGIVNSQSWRTQSVNSSLDKTITFTDPHSVAEGIAYLSLANWVGSGDLMQDAYTAMLTNDLLMSALSGGLAKPLRLDNFLLNRFDLGIQKILHDQVEFSFVGWTDEGVKTSDAAVRLRAAIVQTAADGVPDETLERIRKRALQTANRKKSNGTDNLWRGMYFLSLGLEPNSAENHIERLQNIKKTDVDNLLESIAASHRQITGLMIRGTKK